jgi:hypothetical protein
LGFGKHESLFKATDILTLCQIPERETKKHIQAEGANHCITLTLEREKRFETHERKHTSFPYPAGDMPLTWQKQRTKMQESASLVWNYRLAGAMVEFGIAGGTKLKNASFAVGIFIVELATNPM